MLRWGLLALSVVLLAACSGTEEKSELLSIFGVDEKIVDSDQEADSIYDALTLLKRGEAFYVKGDYIEAAEEFKRFLSLHPFHRMAPFSQFKLAMSYYHQLNTVDRDPAPMEKAMAAFQKVVSQYPQSLYVDEARGKIAALNRRQADYQFLVGHFYYKTEAYPAAIARFKKVLARGTDGALAEKTLYFLGRAYLKSGDIQASSEAFRTLLEKYPHSSYLPKIEKLKPRLKQAGAGKGNPA